MTFHRYNDRQPPELRGYNFPVGAGGFATVYDADGLACNYPPSTLPVNCSGEIAQADIYLNDIIPDGPAAKAGVQAFDVIKQVNDQLVSNPAHLAALVRHFGKDTEVTLLVLRKGQEQKIPVKIGEHMVRETTPFRPELLGAPGMPGMGRQMFERRGEGPRRNNDDPNLPPREPREPNHPAVPAPPADLRRESGPGAAFEGQPFENRAGTTWNTARAKGQSLPHSKLQNR